MALSHPVSSLIGDSLACISDRLQLSLVEMWAIGADGTGHLVHRTPLKNVASDKGTCEWGANAPVILPIPLVATLVGDPRREDPLAPIPSRRIRVGDSDEERAYREAGLHECICYAVLVDGRPEALIALWLSWSLLALAWLAYRDAWLGVMCITPR